MIKFNTKCKQNVKPKVLNADQSPIKKGDEEKDEGVGKISNDVSELKISNDEQYQLYKEYGGWVRNRKLSDSDCESNYEFRDDKDPDDEYYLNHPLYEWQHGKDASCEGKFIQIYSNLSEFIRASMKKRNLNVVLERKKRLRMMDDRVSIKKRKLYSDDDDDDDDDY